jgi:hypothetical protein
MESSRLKIHEGIRKESGINREIKGEIKELKKKREVIKDRGIATIK